MGKPKQSNNIKKDKEPLPEIPRPDYDLTTIEKWKTKLALRKIKRKLKKDKAKLEVDKTLKHRQSIIDTIIESLEMIEILDDNDEQITSADLSKMDNETLIELLEGVITETEKVV